MLTAPIEHVEPVTTAHRAKLAYVYVRQSSATQVRQHQESTELQYRLVNRAASLGWPPERIAVIDDDLGKSGTSSVGRQGFQHLIAEISLGKAGLVLSLDASRLARNNRDWHQLLELCSVFGVLLADGERLYDPAAYHDRLLLGLSGLMSEAELHQLHLRLHQGELQKAARGELRLPLPAGLARGLAGEIILNPDGEVQARLRLVFGLFQSLQSARAVMRELYRHGLTLPVRPLRGPSPHQIVWVPPSNSRVLEILHNPAYAGAYVYGRRRPDPMRRWSDSTRTATVKVPVEQWAVCLHDAHPGYISWEEFMANLKRLAGNLASYTLQRPGAPNRGKGLLQGIAICGSCGRHMTMHYRTSQSAVPIYRCATDKNCYGNPRCQEVQGLVVDIAVEKLLLDALAPDQIALAVAAVGELETQARLLEQQWALQLERARYEAERAWRQYDAVEPENRLVARSLEHIWEDRLRKLEAVEQAYETWRREQQPMAAKEECEEVLGLAQDLPRVWQAATPQERKQMLRLVIHEVVMDQIREPGMMWLRLHWKTGAVTEHCLQRPVQSYARCVSKELLEKRIRELNAAGKMDHEIAAILNAEGIMSARGVPFGHCTIYMLRKRWHIRTVKLNGVQANPLRWPDGSYSVQGVAAALDITRQAVLAWLRKGRLQGHQLARGLPWQITLPSDQLSSLRAQVQRHNRSKKGAS